MFRLPSPQGQQNKPSWLPFFNRFSFEALDSVHGIHSGSAAFHVCFPRPGGGGYGRFDLLCGKWAFDHNLIVVQIPAHQNTVIYSSACKFSSQAMSGFSLSRMTVPSSLSPGAVGPFS